MTNIKHWHEASIRDEPSDFAGPWIYASIPINTNPLDFCGTIRIWHHHKTFESNMYGAYKCNGRNFICMQYYLTDLNIFSSFLLVQK